EYATTAELALFEAGYCPEGVPVEEIGSTPAATGTWSWLIASSLQAGEYQIGVTVTGEGTTASDCSEIFGLQEPPDCDALACGESQNRVCELLALGAACGDCLTGFEASGASEPCVAVSCGEPPLAPAYALLEGTTSTLYGGEASYACDDGYSTTGTIDGAREFNRRCGADGVWEGTDAACSPVDCGAAPAPFPNARRVSEPCAYFSCVARYACNEGYRVTPSLLSDFALTCTSSGRWTEQPTCVPVDCGPLSAPLYGRVTTNSGTTLGATATYACDEGYTLTGSGARLCQASGTWSGSAPGCLQIDCGAAPNIASGRVSASGTVFGSTAEYACDSGWSLSGATRITCGATGVWGTPPVCQDVNECDSGAVCTSAGNVCQNIPGSYSCGCRTGFVGPTVTGSDASCLPRVSLGEPCTADAQCPANSWCSDVPGYRVCAPRLFSGTANTLEFALVPGGTFTQGNPDLNGDIRERPYTATLTRNYFVSRTEVTQGQWKAATGGINPSCFQSTTGTDCSTANANDAGPVETIDLYAALAYTNWLSAAQGLPACYTLTPATCAGAVIEWADGDTECTGATFAGLDCAGYRLLTESEWERAARGGSTWYWYFDGGRADEYAWLSTNAGNRTRPVGQKLPNLYGLFDTAGNVWEL
ncbi:MAG: SUMF1/EgtB/PvdO family nonheme iron enzyme, partial [Myxococcales bacterium]|nr:SUMF1/EgtB/PvdO family nonheme iron enzyme [Myxococcales bacterium]